MILAAACLQCGTCCRRSPCCYGERKPYERGCKYLVIQEEHDEYTIFGCAIYDQIEATPGSEFMPAFGYGCCSSLFNVEREWTARFVRRLPIYLIEKSDLISES